MPAADVDLEDSDDPAPAPSLPSRLPFPPITRSHILNCSVHSWHPRYRSLTPKTRLIPLSPAFVNYLRADGIVLPPEPRAPDAPDADDGWSDDDDEDAEADADPSAAWPDVHAAVGAAIAALGGHVQPKLNWSAPKDATWIAAANTMDCAAPGDVYLLLKSSDFVAHDLDLAFDGCADVEDPPAGEPAGPSNGAEAASRPRTHDIPYHLALRKTVPALLTSMEFRCFVRRRRLLGACPRELKHYDFQASLVPVLQTLIVDFFERHLRHTFPDENFVFDVYVPRPRPDGRVWLIDVNPWAPRTDSLLFSWLELLEMPDPPDNEALEPADALEDGVVRLQLAPNGSTQGSDAVAADVLDDVEDDVEDVGGPEIRLVGRDDPENYSINTPLYSAHKLPMDVVAAGMDGQGGIREFLSRWNSTTTTAENGGVSGDSDGD